MKRIVCFHLFNDYSGSPKVLKMVLEGLLRKGYRVDLVSSRGGALDELLHYKNLHKHSYPYRFSTNPVLTMLRYSLVQLYTFFLSFRWLFCRDVVFYVNTLLPVGPALAGRIMGKRVVYHYHENAFVKGAFYKTLAAMMQKLAHEIVCVSTYQASFLRRTHGVTVVPNALSKEFTERLVYNPEEAFNRKTVLMLSSLKEYKGTREFIEISRKLPEYRFLLVINDTRENIDGYLSENDLTDVGDKGNLTIYARQGDVASLYNAASLVLNLSDKHKIIETFGLTALEAMSAGLPVIVPTEGGIAEMVEDGENGYKIDVQDLERIKTHIGLLLSDRELYQKMATCAMKYSQRFSEENMISRIAEILN
ncbi:MAG: glycosyltransferase family 4 protein [Bacteroidaceae bacterium]|nr:glycosyltransferase family 4 protein [Bacteroidaceae bacterium]